ncbi:MAG TPA: MerR family transcriptional regulator [Bacteroidales bacterium]|jgi:DNA-binding transcriptional MerR regulator|nr:MerR family transcriptional regulator [Bacteroidales bacterium]MDY0085623.1 MerR family transcriptional regulator [Bacteroidales bacterium]HPE42881.1 MerR family transcriptional regulator [Bacteroidales bacterium]
MSTYSIKDLERLTGIKAHTIRIWEKRYGIVDPCRTESNIRWYNDEDLKKLLNISILNRHGYKISRIATLSLQQINQRIMEVVKPESDYLSQIESLVVAMIELCENRFERILNQSIIKIGFEETLYYVVYPFFEKIGLLWQTGAINPAQEHFISNLIRMKLFVAIDSLPAVTNSDAKKIILFLPEWELHEIGLLTYYYIAKKHGVKVYYLGQNVPFEDLISVAQSVEPEMLATYFVSAVSSDKVQHYLKEIVRSFPDLHILISGMQAIAMEAELAEDIKLIRSANEFKSFVKAHQD